MRWQRIKFRIKGINPSNSRNQGGPVYAAARRRDRTEREESSSAYGAIGDMAGQASEYVTESASKCRNAFANTVLPPS